MNKFNWVTTVERIGISSAVTGILLWAMFRFGGWWVAEQRDYHESQTKLTNKLVDAQIEQGKQTGETLKEMNSGVREVRAAVRRSADSDKELIGLQREIRDYVKLQAAPKSSKP